LTFDQTLQMAIEQNRDLKTARAQVDAALGRLKQSGRWPKPRLELMAATIVIEWWSRCAAHTKT
jgi:hypothetical protein